MQCSMARTLYLVAAICLLPGVTPTQHLAGQPMDSTGMGGGLKEPEAPEVMLEVIPQPGTWGWECPVVSKLKLLWAGLELDVTGQLDIQDEELASTRPGHRLRLLLQQLVPRDLEGTEQRPQQLQGVREGPPLSPWDFEQLLLTGLSCIYRLHAASEAEEMGRWAHVFTLLAQEVLWDLCKGFCPQGQPPSLGPWASILDPAP